MRRVLALTRYERLGASSRIRLLQFLPALSARGFAVEVSPLFSDDYVRRLYAGQRPLISDVRRSYARRIKALLNRRRFDLIWIEKEALPWIPGWMEALALFGSTYVIDLDDAWFHRYDMNRARAVRWLLGGKLDRLLRHSRAVIAGNAYLADHARRAGAPRIALIPSVLDPARYSDMSICPASSSPGGPAIIGWIGTPATVHYLLRLADVLRAVAAERQIALHIVGAAVPSGLADLPAKSIPWSEATEARAISEFTVGIMPLDETPWERGKCGYKLLQVMAAGLPVIASPVGANAAIIRDQENGFLASSPADWRSALIRVIDDATLRLSIGRNGRATVEERYAIAAVFGDLATVLGEAASADGAAAGLRAI
jgi:glycosyltransferase involved in cell wall biosynthesis